MPNGSLPDDGPFPGGSRYNAYGRYLRSIFGCRVYKVIVDAGFTCPNRDGTVAVGGCTFCNNESFRPETVRRLLPVRDQVERGMGYLRQRYGARRFIAYFQPFTNTHAPLERLIPFYESALGCPDVVGLAVGTRPDCVEENKLAWFEEKARTTGVTIEYGLESIHDDTLLRVNRGHDFRCWRDAVERTRGRGISLGTHLILGFPWESRGQMLAAADAVSVSGIDVLKLHHLHIVRHTTMALEYRTNPFPLPEFHDYVELVVDFLERLNPDILIERLFGLSPEDQLIAPRWGKTKAEIQYAIERRLTERGTWQGRLTSICSKTGSNGRESRPDLR